MKAKIGDYYQVVSSYGKTWLFHSNNQLGMEQCPLSHKLPVVKIIFNDPSDPRYSPAFYDYLKVQPVCCPLRTYWIKEESLTSISAHEQMAIQLKERETQDANHKQ